MSAEEDFDNLPPPVRETSNPVNEPKKVSKAEFRTSFAGVVLPQPLGGGSGEEARSRRLDINAVPIRWKKIEEFFLLSKEKIKGKADAAHEQGRSIWIVYRLIQYIIAATYCGLRAVHVLIHVLRKFYRKSAPVVNDKVDDIRARWLLTYRQPSRRELSRFGTYESWVEDMERRGRKWSVCAFIVALVITCLFMFLYLVLYTGLLRYFDFPGYVAFFYKQLDKNYIPAMIGMGVAVGSLLLYFLLDMYDNKGCLLRLIGYVIVFGSCCAIITTSLYLIEIQPIIPIAVLTVLAPMGIFWTQHQCFPFAETIVFQIGVLIPLIVAGFFSFGMYTVHLVFNKESDFWAFSGTEFNEILDCEYEDLKQYEERGSLQEFLLGNVQMPCVNAYMEFIAPFYLFMYCFCVSMLLIFVIRVERKRRRTRSIVDIEPTAFWFFFFLCSFLLSMWITSVFLGQETDVDLSLTVVMFSLVILVTFGIFSVTILGRKYLISQAKKSPIGSKLVQFFESDWVHALILFFLVIPVALFVFSSAITQFIRKYTCFGKSIETEEERKRWISKEAYVVVEEISRWEWGSVMTKSLWVGIGFFTVMIGIGRVVALLLSFIGEELAKFPLPVTTAVFFSVGLLMFALPPVPGLPVYLAGGIVLTRNAIEQEDWSFINASLYAALVNYILKLTAIAFQQKVIGELMGSRSVRVRSLCNVNSLELRAIRKILEKKGLSFVKVMILVGGPDWPTSVLTGILRLSLVQMLIGSLPHIFLVLPMSLSGSLLIPQASGSSSETLRPLLLTLSFLVQLLAILIAFHYTVKYTVDHADELRSMEPDQDVELYDEEKKLYQQAKIEMTSWRRLPKRYRIGHIFAVILMIVSNLSFILLGDFCFEDFSVEDSIGEKLDGNVFNVIKRPLGIIMLSLFSAACTYVGLFGRFRKKKIRMYLQRSSFVGQIESRIFQNL